MYFKISAITEKGKAGVMKLLKHKKHKIFCSSVKVCDDPLTINWVFKLFKNVSADKVKQTHKTNFMNLIEDLFLEDDNVLDVDYEVLIK